MGRKPKAAKVAEGMAANVPKNLNPSEGKVASELKTQTESVSISLKKKASARAFNRASARAFNRRSERLKNVAPPARNREIEPVVEQINLCESEKEDEPHVEQNPPGSMPAERRLEEKIDYLVQVVEELKSKATKSHVQSDGLCADLKYKSLYIDSQKKIEALTNENFELSKKLDVALGKIEAYGDANRVYSEVLEKLKDVILITNLVKATVDNNGEPKNAVELKASTPKKKKRTRGSKDN